MHPAVRDGAWGIADSGIYFVKFDSLFDARPKGPLPDGAFYPIVRLVFQTKSEAQVGAIERVKLQRTPGFSVSRDGQQVLWSQQDTSESDLMLAEELSQQ